MNATIELSTSLPMILDVYAKLKCQTSTKILLLGITHSMHDLIFDVSDPRNSDMIN